MTRGLGGNFSKADRLQDAVTLIKGLEQQSGFGEALGRLDVFITAELPTLFGGESADWVSKLNFLQQKYGYKLDGEGLKQYFSSVTPSTLSRYDVRLLELISNWLGGDHFWGKARPEWAREQVRALLYRYYEIKYPGFAEEGKA